MRRLKNWLLVSLCLGGLQSMAVEGDKVVHAGASFALNTGIYLSLRNGGLSKTEALFASSALTFAIGVAKEVFDEPMQEDDIAANAMGIGASFVLMFAVDWTY